MSWSCPYNREVSIVLASALFAAVSGVGLIVHRRRARARRFQQLLEIVRDLAPILGPGSELIDVDQRAFRFLVHGAPLELDSGDVVGIYLRYRGEQRVWQLRQLIGRAQAQAGSASLE